MEAVGAHVPVAGLNNSALEYSNWLQQKPPSLRPPATSTSPLFSSVALCCSRAPCIDPVFAHVPVAGSYNSALRRAASKLPASQPYPEPLQPPPATSTWPPRSRVAVWPDRATFIAPVAAQLPVAGSYSSAFVT